MKLSPQSQAVVAQLLEARTVVKGRATVGPLDDTTRSLLKVIVKHSDELLRLKGEDRASKLREKFIAETTADTQQASVTAQSPHPTIVASPTPPYWKIARLRCQSIRGVAPPAEVFEFDFHGHSNLLYGPNGSGKSSLLGAIIWILTGEAIVDAASPVAEAPLYKPVDGSTAGSKLRDWPIVATLPSDADVTKATPQCWGELHLTRPSDGVSLTLRRTFGSPLQASLDGMTWTAVDDLAQVGVNPLDLQLSVTAPTIFGRRSIEEAEHTRNILGLMLGFDELEQLGELASQMSGNRTRLANTEKKVIDEKVVNLRESLRLLAAQLPEGTDSATIVTALAAVENLAVGQIETTIKSLDDAAKEAEKHLAQVLGLSLEQGKPAGNLADRLTVAVDTLAKGFSENFPSLQAIEPETALPPEEDTPSAVRLADMETAWTAAVATAKTAIARRYEWWKQETAPGSKAALLLKTAGHFEPSTADCPVCERPIEDPALVQRLRELKEFDSRLGAEVRTFFADLVTEHRETVPKAIADLAELPVQTRLQTDWQSIRNDLLGDSFATVTEGYDPRLSRLAIECPEPEALALLPDGCDPKFQALAKPFVAAVTTSQMALALLRWASSHLQALAQNIDRLITGSVDGSLLAQLTKGKQAARLVKPLVAVGKELSKSKQAQQGIDTSRALLGVLVKLESPLDQLKLLSKYAETAVREEFDSIKDTTTEYLGLMYPESPTGMKPGKLKLGAGKNKTVEALLSGKTFEVPGQYFANASLQRAIALAFYFALLKKHPGGLGFIVMDDPILSLDEEHRERWSAHILRPMLATLQVLVATHQRQFLRNCSNDFAADRIVDLNPRDRHRRISWKPGDRLRRAAQQLEQGDHLSAATTMRKFREDLLISLDSYSPTSFFDQNNLAKSATDYEQLPAHNPLAGESQRKISDQLKSQEVRRVLDPGSHSMTEADVTRAMAEDCYKKLELIGRRVVDELARLDRLRERSLRSTVVEATVIPFPLLDQKVTWDNPVELPMVGAAAAKSNPWSVKFHDAPSVSTFTPDAAVQVCGDSLEPVAQPGHWMLLAKDGEEVYDGDLVAVRDEHGTNYLRRVWSDGRVWILQSINPVRPTHTVTVNKRLAGIRKVIGVLYSPLGPAQRKVGRSDEWLPCTSLDAAKAFMDCKTIDVQGNSLNPIARNGQKVLVDEPLASLADCPQGELAVIEFHDEAQGSVIKQVFPGKQWVLVSPNPVDRLPPMLVSPKEILAVWLLRGVLFDTIES